MTLMDSMTENKAGNMTTNMSAKPPHDSNTEQQNISTGHNREYKKGATGPFSFDKKCNLLSIVESNAIVESNDLPLAFRQH